MGKRALIGYVKTNVHDHERYLLHLEDLTYMSIAAGYNPLKTVIQSRPKPTVNFLFGRGKVEEIKDIISQEDIEIFITYNILTSKQKLNLENELRINVIDRYDLTLEIFEQNATSKLEKMQIELARLIKQFPYIKLWASIKYLKERPGYKSSGEYAYHRVISYLRRRIKNLENELKCEEERRLHQLKKRRELGIPIVTLTGYYSVGKTSLFNALTGLRKPTGEEPFTTLSSKYYAVGRKIMLVDTIGFVADLDPRMISSFNVTLNDIRYSDLTILVVDVSERPKMIRYKTEASLGILSELGIDDDKILICANKIDLIKNEDLYERLAILKTLINNSPIIPVSAKKGWNIDKLYDICKNILDSTVQTQLPLE